VLAWLAHRLGRGAVQARPTPAPAAGPAGARAVQRHQATSLFSPRPSYCVYTIQPVVQPVGQPVVSCKQTNTQPVVQPVIPPANFYTSVITPQS